VLSGERRKPIVDTGRYNDGTSACVGLLAREPEDGGEGKPVRMEDTGGSSMERVRGSDASWSMQRLHSVDRGGRVADLAAPADSDTDSVDRSSSATRAVRFLRCETVRTRTSSLKSFVPLLAATLSSFGTRERSSVNAWLIFSRLFFLCWTVNGNAKKCMLRTQSRNGSLSSQPLVRCESTGSD
jgi:hypothetical protein